MKLSAPLQITWLVAVILGVVGIAARVLPIAALAPNAIWLVGAGFALLALGTLFKGL